MIAPVRIFMLGLMKMVWNGAIIGLSNCYILVKSLKEKFLHPAPSDVLFYFAAPWKVLPVEASIR